jgi:hypothetical protein
MTKNKRDRRMTVRLSETLVSELEAEAARDRRALSDYVRQVLIDAVTPAAMQRQQQQHITGA